VRDIADPEGEALLEVLRAEKPIPPEDIPDIFAPAEQAFRRSSRHSAVDEGNAPPSFSQTPEHIAPVEKAAPSLDSGGSGQNQAHAEQSEQASGRADPRPPVNPLWGVAGGTGIAAPFPGGPGTPPGGAGGAWVWLPEGMKPPASWPKRHPFLFWGGCIVLLALIFAWGRLSVEEGPLVGPKIAVINLEGIILDATDIVHWIEKIRLDTSMKGAVLRVNSPGGAVGPSQEIYAALKRLDAVKPVIASMGALAASGGYYASLGAREIYAGPSSLTASIGVKMQVPNFESVMKTIGISETTLTTGKLKDAGSSWRSMRPDEELYLASLLQDMYEEFIQTVSRERKLPMETVRQLADGRAMTGRQALEAKLVDHLGDQHETVQRLMALCRLPDPALVKIVVGPEKQVSLWKELVSGLLRTTLEHRHTLEQPLFMY
jgi:protease-4